MVNQTIILQYPLDDSGLDSLVLSVNEFKDYVDLYKLKGWKIEGQVFQSNGIAFQQMVKYE